MVLTTQERVEIILMCGNRSSRVVAAEFNARHPEREPISHNGVAQLISRFRETGSVADKPRSGRPKTATDEATTVAVLASFSKSPQRSTRRLSKESGVSRTSIRRILSSNKWHPYKIQLHQHLTEDDPDRRVQFAEWATAELATNPDLPLLVLFSDEANFYVNGEVNKQNHRYWSDTNPHWIDTSGMVGGQKVMVWCGIFGTRIIGPFFIYGTLNADKYKRLLEEEILPSVLSADGSYPTFFQQDGAPPHYGRGVREYLDQKFPGRWIGRRGPVEWPPRSPDLTPLDFYLWGHLKSMVYSVKIRNLQHLVQRIEDACAAVRPEILLAVPEEWKRRVAHTIVAQGGHFEHVL